MRNFKDLTFEAARFAVSKLDLPFIMTDDLGLRTVVYPWEQTPTWKLRGKYYLRREFLAFELLIPEGGIVVDIGAHIGTHAMMMGRRARKVFAFEPTPATYQYLLENLALNRATNVEPIKKAVMNKSGEQTFNLFDEANSQGNSFGVPNIDEKIVNSITVETVSLDEFAKQKDIAAFDFVKIDTEGAEMEVLQGAKHLLTEKRIKCFSFETARNQFDGVNEKPEDTREFIEAHGYSIRRFDKDKKEFTPVPEGYNPVHDNLYAFIESQ